MKKNQFILLFIFLIIISSCDNNLKNSRFSNITKLKDSVSYKKNETFESVTIGTQVWMSKNLDLDTFQNGDPIPEAQSRNKWQEAGESQQPAWCYYEESISNGRKYGKLYNWSAVNDQRGLAPKGWHIPSFSEFSILVNYLGESIACKKMKSTDDWRYSDYCGNGNNISGFNGLPGGYRTSLGLYTNIRESGNWWTTSIDQVRADWYRSLNSIGYEYLFLGYNQLEVKRYSWNKYYGLSVRCIKD